ncbi:hypothetical protein FQN54_002165 [Arachnomyces sp. PD_36]|nr:hypothetical protein FQN54_002165 [Arachnomyces sp. PD_36]
MTFLARTLLIASSMAMVAQAVPEVTAVETGEECSAYPKGGFNIQIDQCTDASTGEACAFEGFQNNVQTVTTDWDGYSDLGQGLISIVPEKGAPINTMRCTVGSRSEVMIEVDCPNEINSVGIYEVEGSELIGWGGPGPITIPKPYLHYNKDGEELEGVFLGFDNVTTWGVRYHEARKDSVTPDPQPYYSVRLLAPGSEDPTTGELLGEGESATFLRVSGT